MNPLRTLENMIAGLVEGTFGRMFKAEVRPMELAHKLAREMDENKTISVSRVYAPNEYSVWLSPRDRARYEGVEHEVIDELCAYLLEHARGADLALASRPQIVFHTDESLQLGEFGIEARLARAEESPSEDEQKAPPPPPVASRASASPRGSAAADPGPAVAAALPPAAHRALASEAPYEEPEQVGNTMIFSNSQRTRDAVEQTGARRRPKALLLVSGRRLLVAPRGATIGRSRDCDIVLDDSSVSRRHAELRPGAAGWSIEDLGSTNGVRVNGLSVYGPQEVRTGDRIEIGSTEMLFEIVP
jgi:predicted component of type VI protein secretion system